MAGDAFQKLGDSMNRAITKISVKTSSSLEKVKIKTHIDTLSKDVQKLFAEIGENAYSLWLNGDVSNEALVAKFEAIKQKQSEIENLTAELNSIDERDNQILGTKSASEYRPDVASGKLSCPGCGAECEPAAKFCRKCGFKLQ